MKQLSVSAVALSAAAVMDGVYQALIHRGKAPVYDLFGTFLVEDWQEQGGVEFYDLVAECARLTETLYLQRFEDEGFAGVYAYDVCEPLGTWLAGYIMENKGPPSEDDITKHIVRLQDSVYEGRKA